MKEFKQFMKGKNNYNVFDAIAAINVAIKEKRPYIFMKYRDSVIAFLKFMRKNHYIYNYEVLTMPAGDITSKYIKVYFKYYHAFAAFRNIDLISRPGRYLSITLPKLKKLVKGTNLMYIINTTHGYLSHSEALALKSGGFLIGKII
jgi:ribosomal protein S8